jgi:predicted dehydrogenase
LDGIIRLALVGFGKIAHDQHLAAITGNTDFLLTAIVDPVRATPGVASFETVHSLVESRLPIDAVVVCTPPQVREELALQALARGWHVMLEKPPAGTVSGAMRLSTAAAPGQSLFAAWHSREAPMVDAARNWLSDRTIRRGTLRWREDARLWHPGQHWLWESGGFGVFDPAINAFSILTAISAEHFAVRDMTFEVPVNLHAPIAAAGALTSAQGVIAVDLDFREEGEPCWEIRLETVDGGRLHLRQGGGRLAVDGSDFRSGPQEEYPRLYRRFAQLIRDGQCDIDLSPLQLVEDAFVLAKSAPCEPYVP